MTEATLTVGGMTCAECASYVEQAIQRAAGVLGAHVDYAQAIARINRSFALDASNAGLPPQCRVTLLPTLRTRV